MVTLRLAALALIGVLAAHAQTCTPINMPAVVVQGQTFQPAIVNGIDNVSYSLVRFQWTSDATTNPINLNRIVYATAAQWAANPGTYPQSSPPYYVNVTTNASIQGNVVGNLLPSTTYHIAGQSSTNYGSTWCPAVDETFTTLAFTGVQKPTAPQTLSLTEPTITGTDYTVGVAPCTTFSACVAVANPGDGIGIPPGTPVVLPASSPYPAFSSWKTPASAIAVTPNYTSNNFSTASVVGLTNGEQVHFGGYFYNPSPLSPGATYSLININSTNNTFQVSLDGATPVTLNDNGTGSIFMVPWPYTQSYVVIHSAAPSANLPPPGVRLDPVAYGPYLGVIQSSQPGVTVLGFQFAGYYWFKDIEITVTPTALATETDPEPTLQLLQTAPQSDHIVFDQCWFHPAPAPDRIENGASWGGTYQAVLNSYIDNIDFWMPTDNLGASTVGTNTVTLGTGNYYSVSPSNTRITCTVPASQTLTVSGTSGLFYVSILPSTCAINVSATTGTNIAGSGFNVTYSSTPGFPVSSGGNATQLQIGAGLWNGTSIQWYDVSAGGNLGMGSRWVTESATGWQMGGGPGPFLFQNNFFEGEGIVGVFEDEYSSNACPGATACAHPYDAINLTVQRNTVQWDPKYFNSGYTASPLWNGSYPFARNAFEMKQGRYILYDGNIVGPIHGGLSNGECWDLFTYFATTPNLVNYQKTSDIQISNNTCANSGSTITMEGYSLPGVTPGNSQQRIWIHNNLFLNNNGYLATSTPYQTLAQGRGIRTADTESVTIDHNTFYEQAGTGSSSVSLEVMLSGGFDIENNIFSYSTEAASPGFVFDAGGSPTATPVPASGTQGSALLAYLNSTTFANNVFVGTWSNGNPAGLAEMTSAQVSAAAALYPANTWFPSGSSLANRIAAVDWFAPGAYGTGTGNYRLTNQSPYFSGSADHASDGRDVGANIDALEAAQGKVSNVHVSALGATTANVTWVAPDSFACTLDYGTATFTAGSGSWTRAASTATGPAGARVQTASLTGLTPSTTYTYRVNCAVMQPTGTFQTP